MAFFLEPWLSFSGRVAQITPEWRLRRTGISMTEIGILYFTAYRYAK